MRRKDTRQYFDAEVSELDFNDSAAADVINAWVSAATEGRIDEIVNSPIAPNILMFLINAIYFYGNWTYQFDPEETSEAEFRRDDGTSVYVPPHDANGGGAALRVHRRVRGR